MGGVNQLHLTGPAGGLVLIENPNVGADAGVHEHIGGQLNDAVQPVVLQNVAADFGRAGARVPGEQRRAILNDGHLTLGIQLLQAIEHKQLLPVGNLGQAGGKTSVLTPCSFSLHSLLLTLPVNPEGRVGNDVAEGVVREFVFAEGVTKTHIVRIAAADHHVRLGNGEGGRVELLAEAGDLHLRIDIVNALFHAAEHLTGAHGHVVNCDIFLLAQISAGKEQVSHQVDNVAAGEVRSCFFAEGLGEAANQILKDVAAINRADLIRAKITLLGGKLLDDQVEGVALHHALDDVVKVKLGQHVLHVG